MTSKYVASDHNTYYLGILKVGSFFKLKNFRTVDHSEWTLFLVTEVDNSLDPGCTPQHVRLVVQDMTNGNVSRMSGSVRVFLHEATNEEKIKAIPYTV